MANTIDEEKRWDDMLTEFKGLYDRLSPRNKEIMLNYPLLETEEDAQRCMGFMKMLILFQEMRG